MSRIRPLTGLALFRLRRISRNVLCTFFLCSIFCLFRHSAFAQAIPIACGEVVQGAIDTGGEKDRYTFNGEANDSITIRAVSNFFCNYLELYDPDGKIIASSLGRIDKVLPCAGKYTIVIREEDNFFTAEYSLFWLRLNNSSPPDKLNFGQTVTVSLNGKSKFIKAYYFSAFANDFFTLLTIPSVNSDPYYLELYGPDGRKIEINTTDTYIYCLAQALPTAGNYVVVLSPITDYSVRINSILAEYLTADFTLKLDKYNTPPSVGTITFPASSIFIEEASAFTANYSDDDPAGWEGIQGAYFLINTAANGKDCLLGYYDRKVNKFYLRNDADTGWLGGFAPGAKALIENSYAKIDCGKSAVSGSGRTLTINWSVTFKRPFGNKTYNVYLYAKDDLNAVSGWVRKGSQRIDIADIVSFLPADKSRHFANSPINCAVQVQPLKPSCQYQFLVDGEMQRPFSANNSWSWLTTSQDIGVHTLTVQVKNQNGARKEMSRRLIIYRKPVEP